MKSIILFLVSMFICLGCKNGYDPNTKTEIPRYRDIKVPPPSYDVGSQDFYKATLLVKFENGDPCTTAYVSTPYDCRKNENGILKLYHNCFSDESNPPSKSILCTVHVGRNIHNPVAWKSNILFIKDDVKNDIWPEPTEIVIPDIDWDYYKALVQVKFENGDPCTWAVSENGEYRADDCGFMHITQTRMANYEECPETLPYELKICTNDLVWILWRGEITMIRYRDKTPDMPKAIEVVFPDRFIAYAP